MCIRDRLKVLAGLETLDYGTLTRVKGMTLGYLPQDGLALRGKTVFAECLSVFDHLHALEAEAEQITHTLSTADPKSREYHAAADRYSDIADQLHVHDIYTLDSQVGAVLSGLGFSKEDWAVSYTHLDVYKRQAPRIVPSQNQTAHCPPRPPPGITTPMLPIGLKPATSNQQPATSNQQPATSNQQPATRCV